MDLGKNDTGAHFVHLHHDGLIGPTNSTGELDTDITLTEKDSGHVYFLNTSTGTDYTIRLPIVRNGLTYTFAVLTLGTDVVTITSTTTESMNGVLIVGGSPVYVEDGGGDLATNILIDSSTGGPGDFVSIHGISSAMWFVKGIASDGITTT